jgi:hypothetical protein
MLERPMFPDLREARLNLMYRMKTGEWPELADLVQQMYEALLGYYSSQLRRYVSPEGSDIFWQDQVVDAALEYCQQAGLAETPFLSREKALQFDLGDNARVVPRERWQSGRTFNVGTTSAVADDTAWPEYSRRPRKKSRKEERLSHTNDLWDDEFDA